jgi:hypothetical protein
VFTGPFTESFSRPAQRLCLAFPKLSIRVSSSGKDAGLQSRLRGFESFHPCEGPFVGTMVENSTADTTSDAGRDRLPAPAGVSSWPRIASRYERVGSVMDTCGFESCRGLFAGVVQR